MKTLQILFLSLSALAFIACDGNNCIKGEGSVETQTISLEDIKGIDLQIDADVTISYATEQSITINAQPNIISEIKTTVTNGIWMIGADKCFKNHEPIQITIMSPDMEYIEISGSGDVNNTITTASSTFDAIISGSGNITSTTNSGTIKAMISGSGNINLTNSYTQSEIDAQISGSGSIGLTSDNTLNRLNGNISGSGDINAYNASTNIANLNISGSGDCYVDVIQDLEVEITGSGNVYYKGTPNISSVIFGSGDLIDAN